MKKIMFNDKYGLTEAVLQGRKKKTRRLCKDSATGEVILSKDVYSVRLYPDPIAEFVMTNGDVRCSVPRYQIGEIVAIAQSYKDVYDEINNPCELFSDRLFNSLLKEHKGWNNKMFVKADLMPHRIRFTDLKVERLQYISDEDCLKEGVKQWTRFTYSVDGIYYDFIDPREAFAALIDKVSGRGTWDSNPWVFVYEFKLEEGGDR